MNLHFISSEGLLRKVYHSLCLFYLRDIGDINGKNHLFVKTPSYFIIYLQCSSHSLNEEKTEKKEKKEQHFGLKQEVKPSFQKVSTSFCSHMLFDTHICIYE